MNLKIIFERAFGGRSPPSNVLPKNISAEQAERDSLYGDTYYFINRDWRLITGQEINSHSDLLFGTNAESFCYLLPGILFAFYREKSTTSIVIDYVLNPLISGYDRLVADSFMLERWSLLTTAELTAIKKWLDWYYEMRGIELDEYKAANETIDKLISAKSPK